MTNLPSGTVTFLFTDIEGSTRLLDELGADRYGRLLTEHHAIVRAALEQFHGTEIDIQGDAFFASFPRATEAVAAVVQIQQDLAGHDWPEEAAVRVRMGLHTGEPWLIEEGYVGMDVHRAARIAHVGHGGQVLLSETTSPLVAGELPEGVTLLDLGRHRLKDIRNPEHIHQLMIEGLPSEFPPLASLERVVPPGVVGAEGEVRAPREVGESPYRGLAAFREDDAQFFFGREKFTAQLLDTVQAQRLVAVIVGPSGSGKSSTVFAGLLPQLRAEGEWLILQVRPGREPFQALAAALLPYLEEGLSQTDRLLETQKLAQALRSGDLSFMQVVEPILEQHAEYDRLLLVIDQFEELYTLVPDSETRDAFHDELLAAVAAGSQGGSSLFALLLTLRADFMGQALGHRPFADALQEGSVLLGPMNREELKSAIEKPAGLQGAAFETGLVDRLLDDVGQEPGNLPLLEFALTLLWEQMGQGWLTHAAYEAIGRVEGSLARYADEVYGNLSTEEQAAARRAFVQLVQPGEGTEDTRRIARRTELVGVDWALIQHLADERLVVTGLDESGEETVEVVHEALIRGWGQLREWMDEDRDFRRWQEGLRAVLRAWDESDRDAGALLRGAPLAQAQEWLDTRPEDIGEAEKDFIEASTEFQAQRQRVRDRRRRLIIGGLAIGLVVAAVLSIFAFSQRSEAERNAERAEKSAATALAESNARATQQILAEAESQARATQQNIAEKEAQARATQQAITEKQARAASARNIAASAVENLEIDPQLGLLLAIEAVKQTHAADGFVLPEAQNALHRTIQEASRLEYLIPGEGNGIPYVSVSPDGQRLIVHRFPPGTDPGSFPEDTATQIYDMATGELLYSLPDGIIVDQWPVGDRLGIAELGEEQLTVDLWDPSDGTRSSSVDINRPGNLNRSNLMALLLNPEQNRIAAVWNNNNNASVWDLEAGENLSSWAPGRDDPLFFASTVTFGREGYFETTLEGYAMFSPGGERLLVEHLIQSWGTSLRILNERIYDWNWATGENNRILDVSGIYGEAANPIIALSSDLQLFVVASRSGSGFLEFRDFETWESLGLIAPPSEAGVSTLAISPDSTLLAAASPDGIIKIWRIQITSEGFKAQQVLALSDPKSKINDLKFSPDGHFLVSASADGDVKIWDIRPNGGEELPSIYSADFQDPPSIDAIALSPDGGHLAVAAAGETPVLQDVRTGETQFNLEVESFERVEQMRYSPDGSLIAACSHAGPLQIWDAETGAELLHMEDLSAGECAIEFFPDGSGLGLGFFKNDTGWYFPFQLPELDPDHVLEMDAISVVEAQAPHTGDTTSLALSSNGTRLAITSSDGELFIWDVRDGFEVPSQPLQVSLNLEFPEGLLIQADRTYHRVDFGPAGKKLATAGIDGRVTLWDVDSLDILLTIPAHNGKVWDIAFSPDGKEIVSVGNDGLTKIWDIETGNELLALTGHVGAVTDLAMNSDGDILYTAGADGDVRSYLLNVDELIDLAQSRATRTLTEAECQTYLHLEACP